MFIRGISASSFSLNRSLVVQEVEKKKKEEEEEDEEEEEEKKRIIRPIKFT